MTSDPRNTAGRGREDARLVAGDALRADGLSRRGADRRTWWPAPQCSVRGALACVLVVASMLLAPSRAVAQSAPTGNSRLPVASDGEGDTVGASGGGNGVVSGLDTGLDRGLEPAPAAAGGLAEAVSLYTEGRYAEAQRRFAELAAAEPDAGRRAVLHADAGTAAARAEHLGEAVWHLLEALRLSPRDPIARRNLQLVRVRLAEGRDASQDLSESLVRLPLLLTWREAHLGGNALLALALLLLAVRRWGLGGPRFAVSIALCLLLALGWWAADHLARQADLRRAVVLASTAVRGEPGELGKVLFRVEPGTVVEHEDLRDGWRLVQTAAGGRGWLPESAVRVAGG